MLKLDEKGKEICIRRTIKELINNEKNIVIVPYGRNGRMAKDILNNEFDLQEEFLLDNYVYDMEKIFPINKMPKKKGIFFLVVAQTDTAYKICHDLLDNGILDEQIRQVNYSLDDIDKIYVCDEKVHLDFLCPGFWKCGTTSLHIALNNNKNIFLPMVKETFFIHNLNESSHDEFKTKHYPPSVVRNRIVGGIEPSYICDAHSVYRYFGQDLKLIFCLRNPVQALESFFWMCKDQGLITWTNSIRENFDIYFDRSGYIFKYINIIYDWEKYYPRDQIKLVILEELRSNTTEIMNEIQEFIGLEKYKRINYTHLPSVNTRYNRAVFFESSLIEVPVSNKEEVMDECLYKKLFQYYEESIHKLEKYIGRSLEGYWY